jgi:hypothetical protein
MEDLQVPRQLYAERRKALKNVASDSHNIPHELNTSVKVEFDEETLKDNGSYEDISSEYDYYDSSESGEVEAPGITETYPTEIHHFLTNKRTSEGRYIGISEKFNNISQKYELELDGEWNKAEVPFHRGTHAREYHSFMLKEVENIDNLAQGDKDKFLELFSSLKNQIIRNPELLYVKGWAGNYLKEEREIIE